MEQPAKGMLWMSQAVLCAAYSKRMLHIADSAQQVDEGFGQAVEVLIDLEGKPESNTLEVRLRMRSNTSTAYRILLCCVMLVLLFFAVVTVNIAVLIIAADGGGESGSRGGAVVLFYLCCHCHFFVAATAAATVVLVVTVYEWLNLFIAMSAPGEISPHATRESGRSVRQGLLLCEPVHGAHHVGPDRHLPHHYARVQERGHEQHKDRKFIMDRAVAVNHRIMYSLRIFMWKIEPTHLLTQILSVTFS